MYAEGLTAGCGGGYFCPDETITEADANTFIQRIFGATMSTRTYSYADPDHVHAVTSAGNNTYAYDANGNMTCRVDREAPPQGETAKPTIRFIMRIAKHPVGKIVLSWRN